jgi:hypothetical protein
MAMGAFGFGRIEKEQSSKQLNSKNALDASDIAPP